jgi:Arc/MetJ-type ribon-helix-helix transcriptional regulator
MNKRAGKTTKISVSLDDAAVAVLRRRAARLYRGNLSAAVAEGVRRVQEEEGREALARWLGEGRPALTQEDIDEVRAEWLGKGPKKRRTRAA